MSLSTVCVFFGLYVACDKRVRGVGLVVCGLLCFSVFVFLCNNWAGISAAFVRSFMDGGGLSYATRKRRVILFSSNTKRYRAMHAYSTISRRDCKPFAETQVCILYIINISVCPMQNYRNSK